MLSSTAFLLSPCTFITPPSHASSHPYSYTTNTMIPRPPEPIRYPRKLLNLKFAVLLMRSSYDSVDELDFVPMDEFQISFWRRRASEQESYLGQYSPLKPRIGDLTDPLYFDFINYSQYSTTSSKMQPKEARQVFLEKCPDPEDCLDTSGKRLIRRDPMVTNESLPFIFETMVGDKVYLGLLNGFRGEVFPGTPSPLPPRSTLGQVLEAVRSLLNVMVNAGYALNATVVGTSAEGLEETRGKGEGGDFQVTVSGPATLWGFTALQYQRSPVANAYDALAIGALFRASGFQPSCSLTLTDVGWNEQWTLNQM